MILTRRIGESLNIGDNIIVKVVDIQGRQVRLGIDAPKDVHILRSELKDREDKE